MITHNEPGLKQVPATLQGLKLHACPLLACHCTCASSFEAHGMFDLILGPLGLFEAGFASKPGSQIIRLKGCFKCKLKRHLACCVA